MKKKVASDVIDVMVECSKRLDQSVAIVKSTCTEDELEVYRRKVGKLMGTMLLDIMNPIFDEYPELKPEQLT